MPNKTIYFTNYNLDKLKREENANGLINRLLTNYYASIDLARTTGRLAKIKTETVEASIPEG